MSTRPKMTAIAEAMQVEYESSPGKCANGRRHFQKHAHPDIGISFTHVGCRAA